MKTDTQANNKRIAKNTIVLYLRMLLLMCIGLFTTRIVLETLGVADYGIYNVVGGVVALFSILSQSLSSACSRFLNYEMGRGNNERLKSVFSTSVTIQIVLSIIIAILTLAVGTWFLNNKMNIPSDRLYAANWVFLFSVFSFCINLITIPYNAAIIAHEKMTAFAYISLYEGIAKLLVCYLVAVFPIDKLIIYACLILITQLTICCIYVYYCRRNFDECAYHFSYDRSMFKELFSYAGWNFIGASASILRTQGGNILINLFAGPAVNAARGVANQVNNAISGFSNNFMTAVRPQITKSYASGDVKYMSTLVIQSARLSYYMLLILSLPVILSLDYILRLWLKEVPEYTPIFVVLTIVFSMLESFSHPLITAQLATGNVREYQLAVGGLNLLNVPISYIFLKIGYPPEIFLVVAISISIICLIIRLLFLYKNTGFDMWIFIRQVVIKCIVVSLFSIIIPLILRFYLLESLLSLIIVSVVCFINTSLIILYVGCSRNERIMVLNKVTKVISKL